MLIRFVQVIRLVCHLPGSVLPELLQPPVVLAAQVPALLPAQKPALAPVRQVVLWAVQQAAQPVVQRVLPVVRQAEELAIQPGFPGSQPVLQPVQVQGRPQGLVQLQVQAWPQEHPFAGGSVCTWAVRPVPVPA